MSSKKQQRDFLIYEAIKYIALENKFEERTIESIQKVHKVLGLEIPDVPRTEDLEEKSAFIIEKNRMVVSLYTGFNLIRQEFNKNGALQIVISVPKGNSYDSERVFVRQFVRIPGVERLIEDYLEYILEEISEKNRPLTSSGEWASLLEITQDEFFWVDENGIPIRGFFENTLVGSLVEKNQIQRIIYDTKVRSKRGFKKRRREIKKTYKTKY